MSILDVAIIGFIIMETANVLILYFAPDVKRGNGVAVFNHWEIAKMDEASHLFALYMTNWVAGTKLIFIVLLVVILLTAGESTKFFSIVVMVASIASYYWRLHPIIKKLDQKGHITPSGYAKTLGVTIAVFIIMFAASLIVHAFF